MEDIFSNSIEEPLFDSLIPLPLNIPPTQPPPTINPPPPVSCVYTYPPPPNIYMHQQYQNTPVGVPIPPPTDNRPSSQPPTKKRKTEKNKDKEDGVDAAPRKHCKIKLYDIIMDGLENQEAAEAIKWLVKGKSFQINWEKFVPYYHKRGKSNAKEPHIKNRFTRKTNGFKKEEGVVPESNYDTVYTHISWCNNNFSQIHTHSRNIPNQHNTTNVKKHPSSPDSDPGDDDDDKEIDDRKLSDSDALNLLTQPNSILQGNKIFSIEKFLNRMRNKKKFSMSDSDFKNFFLLLKDETETDKELMTLDQLKSFLVRFGPISLSVQKVVSFVNDGAFNWYHGNISREKSVDILMKYYMEKRVACYLVRSVPIQSGLLIADTTYIFALSYLTTDTARVTHTRLYVNNLGQLCIPVKLNNDGNYESYVMSNFSFFISNTLSQFEKENWEPVPSPVFRELVFTAPKDPLHIAPAENLHMKNYSVMTTGGVK